MAHLGLYLCQLCGHMSLFPVCGGGEGLPFGLEFIPQFAFLLLCSYTKASPLLTDWWRQATQPLLPLCYSITFPTVGLFPLLWELIKSVSNQFCICRLFTIVYAFPKTVETQGVFAFNWIWNEINYVIYISRKSGCFFLCDILQDTSRCYSCIQFQAPFHFHTCRYLLQYLSLLVLPFVPPSIPQTAGMIRLLESRGRPEFAEQALRLQWKLRWHHEDSFIFCLRNPSLGPNPPGWLQGAWLHC